MKPETWWCVKTSKGELLAFTARPTRGDSIFAYTGGSCPVSDFAEAKRHGYRCIRIRVEEVENDA